MILQSLPTPTLLDTIEKPEKGDRLNSISSLSTEATVESSLEGDEDETSDAFSEGEQDEESPAHAECTIIREDDEEEVTTDDTVVPSVNAEEHSESSEVHTDDTVVARAPVMPQRRRSSLKPIEETIPLRNTGWKNLPKLTIRVQKTVVKKDSSSRSSQSNESESKMVQFGTIEIRSYDICIGDNPSVSYGTPVSLDWTYETICAGDVSVDVYESSKPRQRRNLRQMMMNSYHRRHILQMHWDATEADCVQAERAVNRLRNQRCITKALLPLAPLEDCVTSAMRKVKRAVGRPT
jgi:hypothetical protein